MGTVFGPASLFAEEAETFPPVCIIVHRVKLLNLAAASGPAGPVSFYRQITAGGCAPSVQPLYTSALTHLVCFV